MIRSGRTAAGARIAFLSVLLMSTTLTAGQKDARRLIYIRNVETGETAAVQLVTLFGTINVRSRLVVSRLLSPPEAPRPMMLHPRLFLMLQRVADQYPRRTIEIVSGYRLGEPGAEDQHDLGRAVDLRVTGIKNEDLYEFVKTLPRCGTGFYPKADFVHLDVREETETWTDYSHTHKNCAVREAGESAVEGGGGGREILFVDVFNNDRRHLQLITETGNINNRSRQTLSKMAASKVKATRVALLHPRLILLLQRIADEFPGHTFELISGFRAGEKGFHSYHNYGRALDFRLSGVDNRKLYEFVRTLPKTGTGYYPNSVFIHLDVRDKSTTWTDYSGVGEKAQYKKPE